MDGWLLREIWFRSLTVQASLNLWRMQNLGFCYALLPWIRRAGGDREEMTRRLLRHLQPFNTHPYLMAPVLGAVLHAETRPDAPADGAPATALKNALTGPYAAIGDAFFWGAWRPFCGLICVTLAIMGSMAAPLVLLMLYNPPHLWVRTRGYVEGIRKGRGGADFIAALDLPRRTRQIRWGSLVFLATAAALLPEGVEGQIPLVTGFTMKLALLFVMLASYWGIRKGLSPFLLLYGAFAVLLAAFTLLAAV